MLGHPLRARFKSELRAKLKKTAWSYIVLGHSQSARDAKGEFSGGSGSF